jgi:hypothetical protein
MSGSCRKNFATALKFVAICRKIYRDTFKCAGNKKDDGSIERAPFGRSGELCCYPAELKEYLELLERRYPDLDQKAERRLQTY